MRYYYMDTARSIFMILGIFYHTAMVYSVGLDWIVVGETSNYIFDFIMHFLHSFRMHGFYMIAGFFAAFLIQKKGLNFFFKDRVIRLGIPLLTIGFSLNYIMNILSTNFIMPTNYIDYIISGKWLGHLWFLGNLIIYIIFTVLISKLFFDGKIKFTKIDNYFKDKNLFRIIFIFFILACIFYVLGYLFDKKITNSILFIYPGDLISYLPYYLFGFLIFSYSNFYEKLLDIKKLKPFFYISIIGIIIVIISKTFYNDVFLYKLLTLPLEIYCSILISLYTIAYFKNSPKLNSHSELNIKLSESSYTVYLLHMPFIVMFFYLIEPLKIPYLGFIIISILTFFTTYYIHRFVVTKFRIGNFIINGRFK